MQPLSFDRLAPIVDEDVLYEYLQRLASLTAPIAALQPLLEANKPIAYNERTHKQVQFRKDEEGLENQVKKIVECAYKFLHKLSEVKLDRAEASVSVSEVERTLRNEG